MSDAVYNLSHEDRYEYFRKAAFEMGLSIPVIEKDYWVVWALWRIFHLKELKSHLTFKGGTSLSKIYDVIHRFSEDIDLSIEKEFFGFSADQAPENAPSNKKRRKALDELKQACQNYVQNDLIKALNKDFKTLLGDDDSWSLTIDTDDPDSQSILFSFPTKSQNADSYIKPIIKLEMGARSEHWPVHQQNVQSYLKQQLGDVVDEPEIQVQVLDIDRTFWEKITILHGYAHLPETKSIPTRIARHYYDMHCLLLSDTQSRAANNLELLERVAKHKSIYFASGWMHYDTARKGTLKLIPTPRVLKDLTDDFKAMTPMFLKQPPSWEDIVQTLSDFEKKFNGNV